MGTRIHISQEGRRVALTPESIVKIRKKWPSVEVHVAPGCGEKAGYPDGDYVLAGAIPAGGKGGKKAGGEAFDLCLRISGGEDAPVAKGGVLVSLTAGKDSWPGLAKAAGWVLALEKLPRTSRAQAMDVLSSQANLGGYAAVLAAAGRLPRLMPPLMTAAGSSKPANVLVLGVGVAGLQAIATARRLGAAVWAFDVRPEVAEQIASLGAKVVEVDGPTAEGKGGYAGAMDDKGMKVLQEKLAPFIQVADVVISTAQVPGRAAPVLVSELAVKGMKPGSVIVDLAAGGFNKANGIKGGNCPLSRADEEVVTPGGVTILGETDWPGTLAQDASRFWATNMLNLLGILLDKDGNVTFEDELVQAMLVVKDGKVSA